MNFTLVILWFEEHQDVCCWRWRWINILRLRFGVRVDVFRTEFVIGLRVLPLLIHEVMAARSYV